MTWFLVVLVTQMQNELHEGFLWYDPTFKTQQQCIQWVNANPARIIQTLSSEFKDWKIHQTLCVREDRFEDIKLQPYTPGKQI